MCSASPIGLCLDDFVAAPSSLVEQPGLDMQRGSRCRPPATCLHCQLDFYFVGRALVRHHGDVDWMMIRRAPGRGRREPSTVSRSIRAEVDASG